MDRRVQEFSGAVQNELHSLSRLYDRILGDPVRYYERFVAKFGQVALVTPRADVVCLLPQVAEADIGKLVTIKFASDDDSTLTVTCLSGVTLDGATSYAMTTWDILIAMPISKTEWIKVFWG